MAKKRRRKEVVIEAPTNSSDNASKGYIDLTVLEELPLKELKRLYALARVLDPSFPEIEQARKTARAYKNVLGANEVTYEVLKELNSDTKSIEPLKKTTVQKSEPNKIPQEAKTEKTNEVTVGSVNTVTYTTKIVKNLGDYEAVHLSIGATINVNPTKEELEEVKSTVDVLKTIIDDKLEESIRNFIDMK